MPKTKDVINERVKYDDNNTPFGFLLFFGGIFLGYVSLTGTMLDEFTKGFTFFFSIILWLSGIIIICRTTEKYVEKLLIE